MAGPKIDTARHRRPEWTLVLLMVSEKSLPAVPGFVVASLAPGRSFLHPFTLVLLFGHHSSKDRKKDSWWDGTVVAWKGSLDRTMDRTVESAPTL